MSLLSHLHGFGALAGAGSGMMEIDASQAGIGLFGQPVDFVDVMRPGN
ncbi:MAG: hypothetical protein WCB92_27835 [Mycobacterium sp.]